MQQLSFHWAFPSVDDYHQVLEVRLLLYFGELEFNEFVFVFEFRGEERIYSIDYVRLGVFSPVLQV